MESQPPPSSEVKGKVGRRHRKTLGQLQYAPLITFIKKILFAIFGVHVNAALAIVHPCGVLRIFKVRGGIDSKLSSSEILFVVKPV